MTPQDRYFARWAVIWLTWVLLFLLPALLGYVTAATILGAVLFLWMWSRFCDGLTQLSSTKAHKID